MAIFNFLQPSNPLEPGKVKWAPWFEILLFETRLRIRIPRSTAKPLRTWNNKKIDGRPFVNTESKKVFSGYTGSCGLLQFFAARWLFKRLSWRKGVYVEFLLGATGVHHEQFDQYPNLLIDAVATDWINYLLKQRVAFFSQFSLRRHDEAFVEIIFNEEAGLPPPDKVHNFTIGQWQTGGRASAFYVSPFANQLNVFIPYGPRDCLQLIFGYVDNNGELWTQETLCQRSLQEFAQVLVATIELIPLRSGELGTSS